MKLSIKFRDRTAMALPLVIAGVLAGLSGCGDDGSSPAPAPSAGAPAPGPAPAPAPGPATTVPPGAGASGTAMVAFLKSLIAGGGDESAEPLGASELGTPAEDADEPVTLP